MKKFEAIALSTLLAVLPVEAKAEQPSPYSPDARGCNKTLGPDQVESTANVEPRYFEGNWWDQQTSGISSVKWDGSKRVMASVAFRPDTEDNSNSALGTFELTNGGTVTRTLIEDSDNLAWLDSGNFANTFSIQTQEGVTTSIRLCDVTQQTHLPIARKSK